jgi:DNA helicase-2/ATP-dependent DNA helicase PcrA
MWIGTFHSICVKILVSNCSEIGIAKNFTILDEEDKMKELKKVLGKSYSQDDLYMYASFISRAKEHDLYPSSDPIKFKELGIPEEVIDIYKEYHNNIRLMNSLDFDDLIMETIRLFTIKRDLLKAYATRFKYVLMDECQDSAPSHQKLILMLSSFHNNLMLIGDADQSIYGWRGADVSFTLKYAEEKDIKVLTLKNNYRSQGTIVKAADAIIAKNIIRIKKNARAIKADGSKIVYYRPDTPYEEAIFVADIINLLTKKEFRPYSDFTVLYRTNAQARIVEETLARRNIPTVVIGQMSFYKRVEIKMALAYIKVLINPNDFINFQKIVNYPKRGLGEASAEKLIKLAIDEKLNIFEAVNK